MSMVLTINQDKLKVSTTMVGPVHLQLHVFISRLILKEEE